MRSLTRKIAPVPGVARISRTPVGRDAELLLGAVPIAPVRPDALTAETATLFGVDKRYSSTCNSGSQAVVGPKLTHYLTGKLR